jgi:hypothetical protein
MLLQFKNAITYPIPPPQYHFSDMTQNSRKKLFLSYMGTKTVLFRVSQEESAILREGAPYVKIYRYNPKHLCPKLNGYRDNGIT